MKKDKNYKETLKNLALVSQIGLSIISPILLGIYIGQLIDKWAGTEGIFMIVFIILGTAGGFLNLLKLTGLLNKRK